MESDDDIVIFWRGKKLELSRTVPLAWANDDRPCGIRQPDDVDRLGCIFTP